MSERSRIDTPGTGMNVPTSEIRSARHEKQQIRAFSSASCTRRFRHIRRILLGLFCHVENFAFVRFRNMFCRQSRLKKRCIYRPLLPALSQSSRRLLLDSRPRTLGDRDTLELHGLVEVARLDDLHFGDNRRHQPFSFFSTSISMTSAVRNCKLVQPKFGRILRAMREVKSNLR